MSSNEDKQNAIETEQQEAERQLRRIESWGGKPLRCHLCPQDDPACFEEHHIYGRANSEETKTLCKNCHAKITSKQYRYEKSILAHQEKTAEERLKASLLSEADLSETFGQEQAKRLREIAANVGQLLNGKRKGEKNNDRTD